MKNNTQEYINKIRSGGYKNTLSYVNSISSVVVEESSGGPKEPDYLCFTSTGESTVGIINDGGNAPVLFYSTDKENWTSWDYSTITLADGESVYFYGENPDGFSKDDYTSSYFEMTGSIAASGSVQTLLSKDGDREDVTKYCFTSLFNSCTGITTAPKLPATTLAENCYQYMFNGCSSLTTAPELPATTLATSCYQDMFKDCTSLITAPVLPSTTLISNCYYNMFYGCTSLTAAPELPATTLSRACYAYMFYGCTSLTTAPTTLPATTLVSYCYQYMFQGCTGITTAPELPATELVNGCYQGMFKGCSNLQSVTTYVTNWNSSYTGVWLSDAGEDATNPTLYCPSDSTIKSNTNNGIPSGWTRADLVTD